MDQPRYSQRRRILDERCKLRKNCEVAWDIYNVILEFEYAYEQGDIALAMSWLNLLINIEKVNFDIAKYDDGVLYCKCVWEYEEKRMAYLTELNLELIRFHYAWSALECLISYFVPKEKINQHGKINALCGWLLQKCNINNLPILYNETRMQVAEELFQEEQFQIEFAEAGIDNFGGTNKSYINESGYGIYMVYRVRNLFAHGALKFSECFDDEELEQILQPITISKATTIVLMTITMMFYVDLENDNTMMEETLYLKDCEGQSICDFLKKLFV